jgi:hypothetical protein
VTGSHLSVSFIPDGLLSGDNSYLFGATVSLVPTANALSVGAPNGFRPGDLARLDGFVEISYEMKPHYTRRCTRAGGPHRTHCWEYLHSSVNRYFSRITMVDGRCATSPTVKIDVPWSVRNESTKVTVCSLENGGKTFTYLENWASLSAASIELTIDHGSGKVTKQRVDIPRGQLAWFTPTEPLVKSSRRRAIITGRLFADIRDDGDGPKSLTVKRFKF